MHEQSGYTPLAFQNKPELEPHLQLAWDVYHTLSRSRCWSESGPQPIACSEFYAHTARLGFQPGDSEQELLGLVQALDQAYLQDWIERRKKADAEAAKTAKSDGIPETPSVG